MINKFGKYVPKDGMNITFKTENISIKVFDSDSFCYQRKNKTKVVSTHIFPSEKDKVNIGIYPIRPIQKPKQLSHNIMIKLETPIAIPPNSKVTHYLNMPIEIGVFIIRKNSNLMIDAFSLSRPKYSLYGDPDSGKICRFYNSKINSKIIAQKYEEAIIIMNFKNKNPNWVTVNKIVMDAYLVDLYIKDDVVYLEDSKMIIENQNVAHVLLNNKPPINGLDEVPLAAENVNTFRSGLIERTGFGVQGKSCMDCGY